MGRKESLKRTKMLPAHILWMHLGAVSEEVEDNGRFVLTWRDALVGILPSINGERGLAITVLDTTQ